MCCSGVLRGETGFGNGGKKGCAQLAGYNRRLLSGLDLRELPESLEYLQCRRESVSSCMMQVTRSLAVVVRGGICKSR